MYTCPDNEIHSLYLDKELPQEFLAEYEAHIKGCPECSSQLNKMSSIHQVLSDDAKSMDLDREFLDSSFERLQSRMRYSKIVSQAADESEAIRFPAKKIAGWFPAAAAAAAVFALMLPFSMKHSSQNSYTQITPIKRQNVAMTDSQNLVAGSINSKFPISLVNFNSSQDSNSSYSLDRFIPAEQVAQAGIHELVPVQITRSSAVKASNFSYTTLLSDDFFRPEFTSVQNEDLRVYMPSIIDISSLNNTK